MRPIKFRQWISRRKVMHYGIGIVEDGHWNGPPSVTFSIDPLMQFTGLKDRNGKEMFHKDFFRDSTGVSLIEWNEKFASWCLRRNGWAYDHFFGEAVNPEDGEVIGNIYSNPELLEDNKNG